VPVKIIRPVPQDEIIDAPDTPDKLPVRIGTALDRFLHDLPSVGVVIVPDGAAAGVPDAPVLAVVSVSGHGDRLGG